MAHTVEIIRAKRDREARAAELREKLFEIHQGEGGCDSEFEAYILNSSHPEAVEIRELEGIVDPVAPRLDPYGTSIPWGLNRSPIGPKG